MIFRPELAAKIVTGKKTATRRALSDNPRSPWWRERSSYEVGQVFAVQPGRGVPAIAKARILQLRIEPLSALKPSDARREGFPTREAFVDAWRSINGSWDPDQRVRVVEFELAGPDCGGCGGFGTWALSCKACFGTGVEVTAAARQLLAD